MSCSDGDDTASPAAVAETQSTAGSRTFELKPLVEMEVVGACKRGRRKGRRNRTTVERESELEQRRRSKNARERQRVENVKNEYAKLEAVLGMDAGLFDKTREKRQYCKLRILTAAIERIKTLKETIRLADQKEAAASMASQDPPVVVPFSSRCCAESHHSPPLFRHSPNPIPPINQHHFTTPCNPDCQHQLIHYPVIPNQYPSPYSAIHPDTVPYPLFGVYNDPWPPPYIDDWCPAVAPYPTLC